MLDHVVLCMVLTCRFPTSVGLTFRKSWSYSTIAILNVLSDTISSKASCVNLKFRVCVPVDVTFTMSL